METDRWKRGILYTTTLAGIIAGSMAGCGGYQPNSKPYDSSSSSSNYEHERAGPGDVDKTERGGWVCSKKD